MRNARARKQGKMPRFGEGFAIPKRPDTFSGLATVRFLKLLGKSSICIFITTKVESLLLINQSSIKIYHVSTEFQSLLAIKDFIRVIICNLCQDC